MKNTVTPAHKEFALSLRRLLYLQKLMRYTIEDLKYNDLTPSTIVNEVNCTLNAMNRFESLAKRRTTEENWKLINDDLSKDQLHDISLLIDAVSDVQNVDRIVEIIQQTKEEQRNAA